MGANRKLWGVALIFTAVAGCQMMPKKQAPATTQPSQTAAAPTTAPSDGSAEALARKATEWAKMMEALKAQREAATRPTTAPSAEAATTQPGPGDIAAGNREKAPSGETTALVFSPPPAPMIEVHAPTTMAATQPFPRMQTPAPRVVFKDELSQRISDDLKNSPRDPAANLNYQIVRFLKDEQAPDLASLSSLSAEDREAISAVMDGLSNFRAVLRADPNGMPAKKVRPLVAMSDRLRAQTDLQIPTTVLCSAVRGYGAYDPIHTPFVEGRENRALLYCEVSGFASRLGESGMWETQLSEEVVLFRGDTEVWRKQKVDQIPDKCRNRRHDFFVTNLVQFPASLTAGNYTMKVTLIDQIANRVTESTLPVSIAGANVADSKITPSN